MGLFLCAATARAETPGLSDASSPPPATVVGPRAAASSIPDAADPTKTKFRQREGAQLADRRGRFEQRGDRIIFVTHKPDAHYVVLENLALERVVRVIEESGNKLDWNVSGQVTEFRSTNYLLVSRALVKAEPPEADATGLDDPALSPPEPPRQLHSPGSVNNLPGRQVFTPGAVAPSAGDAFGRP